MRVMSEVRKWLPLTVITIATLLGVLLTWEFVDRTLPLHDPMQDFAE